MRSIGLCGGVAVLALWSGCSDPDSGGTDRDGINPGGGPKLTGGAGAKSDGSGGTTDFGNSNNPVKPIMMRAGSGGAGGEESAGAGGEPQICEDGMFCKPTGPDGNCGTIRFKPDVEVTRTPGNLLIVFDQSQSMEGDWGATGKTKMGAAQEALVAAITNLKDDVNVGAVFLPTVSCLGEAFLGNAVPAIDDPTQINFMAGPAFLQAWDAHWAAFVPRQLLGTPLQEGMDRAADAIAAAKMNNLLAGTGQVAVVAFTDGEPNCWPDPMFTMRPTMEMPARAAEWLTQGIKTYVVGLPGADMGAATLNGIAMSGGTMQYIDPADPAALEAKLREVIAETVKTGFPQCELNLDPVPVVPDKLLMIVEEPNMPLKQVPREHGWSLDASGRIEITGALCEAAMDGRLGSIGFTYACPDVPPPPPIPPVE